MPDPRCSSSRVRASSSGMASMSKSGCPSACSISTVSLMTSRLRRPRKSIFSRPSSSTPCISYCVTTGDSSGGWPLSGLRCIGEVLGQRLLGDHHGRGVDAVGALQALQPLGDVDDLLHVGVGVVHRPQLAGRLVAVGVLRDLLEAVLERRVAAHHERRHGLGDAVADGVREAEHARRVADRVARLDRAERDDLGDVIAAVALGGVADHLVPVAGVEVHVDVGHRDAARVEEALEQQVVLDGVEVGDPQGVGDGAPGRRPAARDRRGCRRRERGLMRSHTIRKYELNPIAAMVSSSYWTRFLVVSEIIVAPAGPRPLPRHVGEVAGVVDEPLGQREVRQLRGAELDVDLRPLGDPQRVVARLGHLAEEVAHLVGGLEVVLLALELEALRVRQHGAGLHAEQGVVGLVVLAVGVVGVVGGQQRRPQRGGQLDQLRVGLALGRQAVVLQLDEEVVAPEDLLQPAGLLQRALLVALQQRLQDMTAEAAGGGDQALAVLGEQLPVEARLVVVALEEGLRREVDEVAVADVVDSASRVRW